MAARLVHALGSSARTAACFSDEATLRHMLRFEAALAHAVAAAGLIQKKHAAVIEAACDASLYDPAPMAEAAPREMACVTGGSPRPRSRWLTQSQSTTGSPFVMK